jgi:hypothetical protein
MTRAQRLYAASRRASALGERALRSVIATPLDGARDIAAQLDWQAKWQAYSARRFALARLLVNEALWAIEGVRECEACTDPLYACDGDSMHPDCRRWAEFEADLGARSDDFDARCVLDGRL